MIMYVSVEEGSPGTGSGGSANFYIFRNRFARTGANPWIPPLSLYVRLVIFIWSMVAEVAPSGEH